MAPYNKNTDLLQKDLKGWLDQGVHPLIMMGTRDKAAGLAESLKGAGLPMAFAGQLQEVPDQGGVVFQGSLTNGFYFWDEKCCCLPKATFSACRKNAVW